METTGVLTEITSQQTAEWMRAIEACAPYDFYHLPQYHVMAEEAGEGTACLFVYHEGSHTVALPLLLRDLDGIAEDGGSGWLDATSVYGYPGPLAGSSSNATLPDEVVRNFQSALSDRLREKRVVTVFCRLNPFLTQRPLLSGLGSFHVSETVAIDLTLSPELQRTQYRSSFKGAINKLRRAGLTVVRDTEDRYVDDFFRIYTETMRRVEAKDRYFFPSSYFETLRQALGGMVSLFVCLQDGVPVCGGLFVACQGIVQYHLGGTLDTALHLAPMKLLMDEVRLWANTQGLRTFHLGGGTTSDPEDPLLYFKRGFSDQRCEFAAWRWVVLPEVNETLCDQHARRMSEQFLNPASPDFFPAYRCPGVPMETAQTI